ncbi:MAG: tetratricopeptide repeat protein, partial [Thermodesulfovibrionales bacterium]|nr:tetratricopeptide repeat protein [Thermodesulfovibrionales bacterium]
MKKIKRKKTAKELAPLNLNHQYKVKSAHADEYYWLGYDFQRKGHLDKAILCYQKSLQLNPMARTFYSIGTVFHSRNQIDEAVIYYQKAIHLDHSIVGAHYNIATIFQGKKLLDKAIVHYQKVIELNPGLTDPYYNLGLAYQEQGRQKEAFGVYDKALRINPSFMAAQWARCMAQIPPVYPDRASVAVARENYSNELLGLRESISLRTPEEIDAAAEAMGRQQPFFLAYQGLNDRELQQLYGDLAYRIMSAKYPQFSARPSVPSTPTGEPLRIGLVSAFFHYHAVWKIPIRGWIENIDKKRFSLFGYYTGNRKDGETASARKYCTRFVEDVFSPEDLCALIRKDNLHVLIFPEIGMDPITVKLASLWLAPIQCASWGHPDTSGLPTIDYYLSGDLIEPFDGDLHYTEKLMRLPHLSVYYTPPEIRAAEVDRDTFGLRRDSVLYHCCQSLYKYSPEYDDVFPRIAREVGDCLAVRAGERELHAGEGGGGPVVLKAVPVAVEPDEVTDGHRALHEPEVERHVGLAAGGQRDGPLRTGRRVDGSVSADVRRRGHVPGGRGDRDLVGLTGSEDREVDELVVAVG